MLNPIEECFSKVKNLICKLQPEEGLLKSVQLAFDEVTKENCVGWFLHSKKSLPQCFNSEEINVRPEESPRDSGNEWSSDDDDELLRDI